MFAKLAKDNESITLLIRSDAEKMGFLFCKNVIIKTVDYKRFIKNRRYRKELFHDLYTSHFRLLVSSDFLRHPKRDELLIQACKADTTLAMESRPWTKYNRPLRKNRSLYDQLFESGPPILDKILRWSKFANWLTNGSTQPPQIRIPTKILPAVADLKRPTILFIPFSAVKEKQLPASLYEAIADLISNQYDIIISCGPGDLKNNPDFMCLLNRPNVTLNESSFYDLIPIIRGAKLVVSVDTAGMHLSVGVGTQTLCLASAAYVGEIVPYDPSITPTNANFIYISMECQSCLGSCIHPIENGMFLCISRIAQGNVLTKVSELLGI